MIEGKRKKSFKLAIGAMIAVGFLAVFAFAVFSPLTGKGVVVRVKNAGPETIRDIRVGVTGEAARVNAITPGDCAEAVLRPQRETAMTLAFVSENGRRFSGTIDIYLEKDYAGTISISVDKRGLMTWEAALDLPRLGIFDHNKKKTRLAGKSSAKPLPAHQNSPNDN